MKLTNQILLYGIGGPEKSYAILKYFCIFDDYDIVRTMTSEARRLAAQNPSIKAVYAIDNSYRLKREYREAVRLNSIEGYVIFKDLLEREGTKLNLT